MRRLDILRAHLTPLGPLPTTSHIRDDSKRQDERYRKRDTHEAFFRPGLPIPHKHEPIQVHQTSGDDEPLQVHQTSGDDETSRAQPLDVGVRASHLLPGPIPIKGWRGAFVEYLAAVNLGESHVKEVEWCREYGGSMTSNIVVPSSFFWREGDEGKVSVVL